MESDEAVRFSLDTFFWNAIHVQDYKLAGEIIMDQLDSPPHAANGSEFGDGSALDTYCPGYMPTSVQWETGFVSGAILLVNGTASLPVRFYLDFLDETIEVEFPSLL